MEINEVQIFKGEFGEIRTAKKNGVPFFCLKDICEVLGITNSRDVKSRLDVNGVGSIDIIDSIGRKQKATFVDEGNLYMTVFHSRKPNAKEFARWVTKEVLPSIRQNGIYAVDELLNDPDFLIETIQRLKVERTKRLLAEGKIQLDKPKVEFFNSLAGSKDALELSKVHKTLNMKNVSKNLLFQVLRDEKIINYNNLPYPEYIDKKYFRVVKQSFVSEKGDNNTSVQVLVYQRGYSFIRKLIYKKMGDKIE